MFVLITLMALLGLQCTALDNSTITFSTSTCTWTTYVDAIFTKGPTSTYFTSTTTATKLFNCHGCYHISTVPIGHDFWVVSYTTTVTATTPTRVTSAICSPTPIRPGCVGATCVAPAVTTSSSTCSDESRVLLPTAPGPVIPASSMESVATTKDDPTGPPSTWENPSATFTTVKRVGV